MISIFHIAVCRKPLDGTVIQTVQKYGTGGLNIDGCRIATNAADSEAMKRCNTPGSWRMHKGGGLQGTNTFSRSNPTGMLDTTQGRFPANLIHDGSDEVVGEFPSPHNSGAAAESVPCVSFKGSKIANWGNFGKDFQGFRFGDSGSAARFFKKVVT